MSFRWYLRFILGTLLGAGWILALTGCVTHVLADRIVAAPNRHGVPAPYNDPELLAKVDAACIATWKTKVGSPDAEIAVGVMDPTDFHLKWDVTEAHAEGKSTLNFSLNWSYPEKKPGVVPTPPKGTLVFLHGILMTRESMLPWAMYFAERQYRVVLVDLRGHGRSTGKRIGFGAWEVNDLMKVTDELQRRGLLVGKLGVFGASYGAAVGLQWAAQDNRVSTVIALMPYSEPRAAIKSFARGFDPGGAGKLSDATFVAAEAKAEEIAGIHWRDLSIVDAVRRLRVPVLFFHGLQDTWIGPSNSQVLRDVAPPGSQLITSNDNHISLQLRSDTIGPKVSAWLDERLVDHVALAPSADVSAASAR